MVPTSNLLRHDSKNSNPYCPQYCITTTQLEAASSAAAHREHRLSSRFPRLAVAAMADDDDDGAAERPRRHQAGGEAAGTSSRGGVCGGDDDRGWLQLSLATASSSSTTSSSGDNHGTAPTTASPAPPMEPGFSGNGKQSARTMVAPPLFPMPIRSYGYPYGHGPFWPTAASGSVPAPFLPFARPLRSAGDLMMRVISPPRRTEAAGLWLTLEAAPNQAREPILPQIPKSYLRIKDSNIKVEMVMKYLADKLGLTQSHQVELTCGGQPLPPFLLVKYVRDSIWRSSAEAAAPPCRGEDHGEALLLRRQLPAAATDHVMTLFYSTSRNRITI